MTASYGNWEGGENTTGKQEKTKIGKWIIKRGVKKIEMLECWKDWMGERYHIVKCSKRCTVDSLSFAGYNFCGFCG